MRYAQILVAALAAATLNAAAADITGAGATFPYPIYAKWADAYKKADRHRHELPVDRLRRRHQADHREDRRLRRLRHADEARGPAEERPDPVPGDHGRRGAGRTTSKGVKPGELKLTGALLADIYLGKVKKWNDPAIAQAQPGREAAGPGDHRRAPLRRLGHHVHLSTNYLSKVSADWKIEGRRRHLGEVADGRGRQGQRRRGRLRAAASTARSATSSTPTPSRTSSRTAQMQNRDGQVRRARRRHLQGRGRRRRLEQGARAWAWC